jgi:hypothetical protein
MQRYSSPSDKATVEQEVCIVDAENELDAVIYVSWVNLMKFSLSF